MKACDAHLATTQRVQKWEHLVDAGDQPGPRIAWAVRLTAMALPPPPDPGFLRQQVRIHGRAV